MIPTDPDDRDVLAGEYVLGLLPAAEAAEIEARLPADRDLARRVATWETHLAPFADTVEPVPPRPDGWAAIERVIRPGVPTGRTSPTRRLWDSAPAWRGIAALATAAAVLLAVLPSRERGPVELPPRYVALLQTRDAAGAETGPGWLIQIAEDGTVRSLPFGRVEPGEGRSLQLWTLWDPGRGPVSLGVLPPGGAVRLPRESLPVIGGGQLFEITLEPQAGSPTGRPTGRVLFIGRAASSEPRSL